MPQGRRKTPFSGKQKKQQLVAKRQSQKFFPNARGYNADSDDSDGQVAAAGAGPGGLETVQKINYQASSSQAAGGAGAGKGKGTHANRYALQFYKESDRQLRDMREQSRQPMHPKTARELEVESEYFDGYDFPKRPEWTYRMSKEQLNAQENRYFTEYVMKLERQHADEQRELSYFELNLETWRQLWRVLEISDIVLVIVDIRYPTLMFPPALFEHVTKTLRKDMILVLNKVDLAPAPVVLAWRHYFETKYRDITLVMFTSFPGYNLRNVSGWTRGLQIRRRRGKQRMAIEGAQQVLDACRRIGGAEVDLSSWEAKIAEETRWLNEKLRRSGRAGEEADEDDEDDDDEAEEEEEDEDVNNVRRENQRRHLEDAAFDFEERTRYQDGVLTVGCVGLPNVGKSSVMNALMGRKVVSVSKTPGHTKHFQTIYLTPNVRLCDCPGLVFPSAVPRPLQVLIGSYPIAQLRVPNAAVRFLAERMDLRRLLDVKPEAEAGGRGAEEQRAAAAVEWSALDLCEAWALKRGYLTAKAGRPDCSRAANSILRMALEGQIAMCMLPVGYGERKDFWATHADLKQIEDIQAFGKMEGAEPIDTAVAPESSSSSDQEDDSDDEEDDAGDGGRVPRVQNAFALLNTDD